MIPTNSINLLKDNNHHTNFYVGLGCLKVIPTNSINLLKDNNHHTNFYFLSRVNSISYMNYTFMIFN